jgi:hypothetical protein
MPTIITDTKGANFFPERPAGRNREEKPLMSKQGRIHGISRSRSESVTDGRTDRPSYRVASERLKRTPPSPHTPRQK